MKGWHSRGYLPHYDGGEILQFITIHLADALPVKVIDGWKFELAMEKDEMRKRILRRRCEKYLDGGRGECFLRIEAVAELVENALLYFDGEKYKLISWVIMPNHMHFLIRPAGETSLTTIMHSFKSYTAHEANRLLKRTGKFWQADYFDRYIRDRRHFERTLSYIEQNPVKAGLCEKACDWRFSSAYKDGARASRSRVRKKENK